MIYAYERQNGEIIAYIWGNRSFKIANRLRKKLKITYDCIATDHWDSFVKTFQDNSHLIGKAHTLGIEGNNCRLCHRIRRFFRKTCDFSKKLLNHFKTFKIALHYINFGTI